MNKLPDDLIRKLILYSSDEDDVVGDFFMGNFTTAYIAIELDRKVVGFEINTESYDYHISKLGFLP
jgi:site-specific DNA-methyltransferase (adenine-specific)